MLTIIGWWLAEFLGGGLILSAIWWGVDQVVPAEPGIMRPIARGIVAILVVVFVIVMVVHLFAQLGHPIPGT